MNDESPILPLFSRTARAAILLPLAAVAAFAQSGRGGISGTVTDSSGAIVSGASVTALDQAKGTKLTTVTTGGGLYSFVSLATGTYTISVTHAGFDTAVSRGLQVSVDQTRTVNMTLHVGAVSTQVVVNNAASLVDTSSSTVGQLISAQEIDRVPLVTRDVYQLVQLSAGVAPANGTPNSSDTPAINNARSLIDVSAYTVNGSLQGSVYYMLDGSPIGIAENNAATIIPAFQVPEDGVEEFRVETQNTPASYQSGGGGVISLVTKSGTNAFHGDAFSYFRPNALAANDYFYKQSNPGAPPLDFHRYQEGGSIGGPIKRDKLFFFADYEATQQELLENGYFTVPTAAERGGDFSADSFTIYNPLVADNPDGTRQAFSGNVIPVADLDPVAQNFTSKFPSPNAAGEGPYHTNNYTGSGLDPLHEQKFDVRLDDAMSEKNRLFGRFSFGRLDFGNADLYGSSNPYDPYYYVNITNTRNVLIGDDYTLNPTTVVQLRYSFTRHYEDQTGDPRQSKNITDFGFPQSLADQVLYQQSPVVTFATTTAIGGTGNEDTFLFASEDSDASVSVTKVLGKHELSAGFEYQERFMNIGQPVSPAGQYGFDNTATSSTTYAGDGSDFASFLIGMGSAPGNETANFTKDVFAAEANPYYGSFIQDNYHVTPTFTLNLGLRWDVFGGRTERHNRQEWFNPLLAYTLDGVALTGGEQFVSSGNRSPFTTNLTNFGPKASFTWQTMPMFVFRGGAGIYYGPSTEMVANPALNSDGFGSSTTWNATTYNSDGNTVLLNPLSNPFPNGVVQPTGSSLGPATNIGVGLASVLRSPRTLTTYNYNIGFESQFPGQTVLSVAYVGSRGLFLPLAGVDLNTLPIQTIAKYNTGLCVTGGAGCQMVNNTLAPVLPATNPYYGAATVPLWFALEPYPQFSPGSFGAGVGINGYAGGDSEYDSLQAKVEKHMSHHISSLASFTWGKIMTDDAQPPLAFVGYHSGFPQDWRNLNLEHSVSGQDVKLQFNWQLSWELPIGKGRALDLEGPVMNSLLGGWTLNTITYLSDGVPIAAPGGTGNPYFNQRVNLNCDPAIGAPHTAAQWFSYACFSQPGSQFVPGTAPAYLSSVRTQGARDLDVSVYKAFALGGDRNLRIEVSSYNVTNSVQFGYPNVFWNPDVVSNPSVLTGFGQITSASNTPRQFQFGARFTF